MRQKAKYRIREDRVSYPSGGITRAFIAEKLVTVFGVPLFYWPCTNADWRLNTIDAISDIDSDQALYSPLSPPVMFYPGRADRADAFADLDIERQKAADETFADLPGEIHITLDEIADFSRKYPSLEPAATPEPSLTKWPGWDQSNLPWSEAKHKDAVCYALFGDAWWMDDAAELIGFIDKTWGGRRDGPVARSPQQDYALERALDFIESLTDQHFMMGMDTDEAKIDDIRDHARIELASIRKLLAAEKAQEQ